VAVHRTAGWGTAQRFIDHCKYAFEISIDVVVPEPQYPEALTHQAQIALRITLRMDIEVVLAAVELDDETMFQASKIDDKIIARSLTPKMKAALAP